MLLYGQQLLLLQAFLLEVFRLRCLHTAASHKLPLLSLPALLLKHCCSYLTTVFAQLPHSVCDVLQSIPIPPRSARSSP